MVIDCARPSRGRRRLANAGARGDSCYWSCPGHPGDTHVLAQAYAKLGRLPESQTCLAEAGQIIEATDERWSEAELHRVRGDVLNIAGDRAGAEQSYHLAFAVAQRQSAKIFELRAATSLARIWHDQGNRTAARELLAPSIAGSRRGLIRRS